MVGFDDLGGVETFTTRLLEDRLASQSSTMRKERNATLSNNFALLYFVVAVVGIFQVFGKFKVSADRRDLSESEDDDY